MYVSDPSIIQMELIVGLVFVMPQDLIISYSFVNIQLDFDTKKLNLLVTGITKFTILIINTQGGTWLDIVINKF